MKAPDGLYRRLKCEGCGALLGLTMLSGRTPVVLWCPKCFGIEEEKE